MAGRDGFEPKFAPHRPGEIERTALDASRAEQELGWRAERNLDAGLEQTLAAED
jgi:UDP-glucose 4-epimerase